MADPYQYINSTGLIVPDTSEILGEVQQEYKDVFTADLVVTPDTPQGVLINTDAQGRVGEVNNNAAVANQINPNIAGGTFLDAIMAMTGMERNAAQPTIVPNAQLTGVAGTVISQGTQAKTAAGDVFQTMAGVTLDSTGSAFVTFASVEDGPIPCAVNTLTMVVSNVLGWETVTNPTAGILGVTLQSDQAARALRNNTLAFQGVALPIAIISAVNAVPGVNSLKFLENYKGVPSGLLVMITGGTTLAGQTWGLVTAGNITVGTSAMDFELSAQNLPVPNPWPVADFSTIGNVSLSGLATQGGGDWPSTLTAGNIILVKNNTSPQENGLWVAASGGWTRQAYNVNGSIIVGALSGISLVKNSIYMSVDGGTDLDVAAAMLENKSSGCDWNGNTDISIVEPASGQSYDVLFDRPALIGVLIKITTTNGNTANIIQAILDYANGLINGLAGLVVGASVSPFEISGAIMSEYPAYYISKVELSLTSSISYSVNELPIGVNQKAFTQSSYITVVIAS